MLLNKSDAINQIGYFQLINLDGKTQITISLRIKSIAMLFGRFKMDNNQKIRKVRRNTVLTF